MSSTDKPSGAYLSTKPRSDVRHWSTYASVSEWSQDYHGYVPIQMAAGLDRQMRGTRMSFPDAYRALLGIGAIIHIDPVDDLEPPPVGPRDTVAQRAGAARLTPGERRTCG